LADARGFADVLDLLRPQRLDGRQAQAVELAQRDLIIAPGLCSPLAVSWTASRMGYFVLRIAI